MKKYTLLLQFRTDESLEHEQQMIQKFGDFSPENMEVVNVLDPEGKIPAPEDLDKYNGVITGASGQFNTSDWSEDIRKKVERVYPFFREVVRRDFPMLAICFGHQLLAKLFGGEVEKDESQAEVGTVPVYLTAAGEKSKIFAGISNPFYVVSAHKDSVTNLPKGAELLAYSDKCKYISYSLGENIFCTQFHAELDLDALMWRLSLYPEYMQGKSAEEVRAEYHEIPEVVKILNNFHSLINRGK